MIIIVVDGKCCWRPVGFSGMAAFAIGGQSEGGVAGVCAVFIIRGMAPCAGVGGSGVITVVACVAVVGDGGVRAREGVERIVVERRRCPSGLAVACLAVGRESGVCVVGVRCRVVVLCMAAEAGVRCTVVVTVVASCTFICDSCMSAVKLIKVVVDSKSSWHPVG